MVVIFKAVGEREESESESGHNHEGEATTLDDVDHNTNGNTQPKKSQEEDNDEEFDELSPSYKEIATSPSWFRKLQIKVPRLFYITTELVIPLLVLIGMSFLFGFGLATLEKVGEIEANDEAVGEVLALGIFGILQQLTTWAAMSQAASECLVEHTEFHVNATIFEQSFPDLNESIAECAFDKGEEKIPSFTLLDMFVGLKPSLSFHWMACPDFVPLEEVEEDSNHTNVVNFSQPVFELMELNPEDQHDRQYLAYIINFLADFKTNIEETGLSEIEVILGTDLLSQFVGNTTGSKECKVHVAGGALFWFTIMTTM